MVKICFVEMSTSNRNTFDFSLSGDCSAMKEESLQNELIIPQARLRGAESLPVLRSDHDSGGARELVSSRISVQRFIATQPLKWPHQSKFSGYKI